MQRRSAKLAGVAAMNPVHGPGLVVPWAQRDANGRFPRDASRTIWFIASTRHRGCPQRVIVECRWRTIRCQIAHPSSVDARCVGNTLLLNRRTNPYTIADQRRHRHAGCSGCGSPLVTLYRSGTWSGSASRCRERSPSDLQIVGMPIPSGCTSRSLQAPWTTERLPAGQAVACLMRWILVVDSHDNFVFNLVQYSASSASGRGVANNDHRLSVRPQVAGQFDGVLPVPRSGTPGARARR